MIIILGCISCVCSCKAEIQAFVAKFFSFHADFFFRAIVICLASSPGKTFWRKFFELQLECSRGI